MKRPTNKEKIARYESLFHSINNAATACRDDLISKYIRQIDHWSYSHRMGNGMLSESKQNKLITEAFYKLGEE